ncbi:MAG: DUF1611 domain-containing protein [Actinobacteria bacterium]|nr:DUF1611 domain-containing protein [Actinomycetota bacterium]
MSHDPLISHIPASASPRPTAVIYCEANFARLDGKTANGLVRSSETYEILSIIDSTKAGLDSGMVLDGVANNIPIHADLDAVLANTDRAPDAFIYGVAPATGLLEPHERSVVLDAISRRLNIVNGLHEFLNDDPEFAASAAAANVTIHDVRRPRAKKDLRLFSGRIETVTCPRIAVLGTDGAIGKRTTSTILTKALRDAGINAVMISTGQTGLIQGARYGLALDAIPSQFCSGEIEAAVIKAFEAELPDVIIVEGQGALSHPAYLSSTFVLRGARPDGVILQHAPGRKVLGDFPMVAMPTAASEIRLIETFAPTTVIGLTINHENMTDGEIDDAIIAYQRELAIPVTDALARPAERLVDMVLQAFPILAALPHVDVAPAMTT